MTEIETLAKTVELQTATIKELLEVCGMLTERVLDIEDGIKLLEVR